MSASVFNRYIPKFLRSERRTSTTRALPVKLSRQRIFILPTRYGVIFGLLLFVMLVGSTNYSNSLGFVLTFLLASLGIISILHSYRNMARLTIHTGKSVPVYCGELARYVLHVDNDSGPMRYAIGFQLGKQLPDIIDIQANGTTRLELRQPATKRGWLPMNTLTISTRFPLGLVHAWSRLNLSAACLVYPRPAGMNLDIPSSASDNMGEKISQSTGNDDFLGFRNYHPGDSPRHVDWKAVARGQELLTKQFADTENSELWLDWDSLPGLDTEQRLGQLCHWVLDIEAAGSRYGLRLPDLQIPIGHGAEHKHRCLEALALYEGVP
ncbi:MAG TPA: DUF58 domain-containing protein [Gammaproteobacteria bacterium]